MDFVGFIWLFFLISALTPMLQQRWVEAQRIRIMRQIEEKRNSRIITLIHRQESIALLGIPIQPVHQHRRLRGDPCGSSGSPQTTCRST